MARVAPVTPQQRADVETALFAYWTEREDAAAAQAAKGTPDVGGRAGVTSGGHLDHIAHLLGKECLDAGAPPNEVFYKAPKGDPFNREGMSIGFTLPGHYRPTKQWDLVVWHQDVPIVVVELKSQNGPSFSNNANNRAEEAVGNAVDFQRAKDNGLIPGDPWTGYVYVIEEDMTSTRNGGGGRMPLSPDPSFTKWSYTGRVAELSHRLVADGLYQGVWPVATASPGCRDKGVMKPKPGDRKCPQLKAGIHPCQHTFGWQELDPARYGYGKFVDQMTSVIRMHPGGTQSP